MSKKTRAERNLKFETLQLHVGQEIRTQLQMQEQYQFTRLHHMYLETVNMPQQDLVLQMQVIFTADLQIRQRMYLKRELQHLKVV